MKTKNTKHASIIYMIGFGIGLSGSLYLSINNSIPELWIWISFAVFTVFLFYLLNRRIKRLLLLNFQRHLQLKVQNKDWPIEMSFPMNDHIKHWIDEYEKSIDTVLSHHVWSKIKDPAIFQRWMKILKEIFVPVIGISGGISLYTLYSLESVYVEKADVNTISSSHEFEMTKVFLEYMPVRYLTVYVHPPIHLTPASLYYLMIRDEKIGNFNEVCLSLMKTNCEIIAPMAVIEQLMSVSNAQVPIVFPQRFLAYLIKMEVENRFNLKADPEKRKKVFDWYMSQESQSFDFYSYWPKFIPEELEYVLSKFEGDAVRDEIFVAQKDWKHVSLERLKIEYKPFVNNWRTPAPDGLADALFTRV